MIKRIGPRMQDVVSYVSSHPGCVMLRAAEHVAPRGSRKFGYRTVHRTIKAGLITMGPGPRGCWLLTVVQ